MQSGSPVPSSPHEPCLGTLSALSRAISRASSLGDIYEAALDALHRSVGVTRSSILLFDDAGVMRFVAWRGLSERYRAAVEGHSPWRPDTRNAQAFVVSDPAADPSLAAVLPIIQREGIAALGFVPLTVHEAVLGKFMLYFDSPPPLDQKELELATVIADQVAFAVQRMHAEEDARRSEEQLRYALDAAMMGTWDWDLESGRVRWSDNLLLLHGMPPERFDGTFATVEREIHPGDREHVLATIRRALAARLPYEVEYRIVRPDGVVRWVEAKGRVVQQDGRAVRMSGICMDVTRRKLAELQRLESLHDTNRLKDEFLAVLSHELRTPLNAIMGWVQMLETGALPPERIADAIAVIGRNARLQAQLVNDILDVSRIITGKLELERRPVPLASAIDHAVNAIRPAALAKNLQLDIDLPPDLPHVAGDPARLQQVLGNVLANAVKFTGNAGRVSLRCELGDDGAEVVVTDTGIGIERDFLPYVFDRFRQADSSTTRTHGGLGLGLALARHLVECHGGTITAESDGAGRGATFRIRLPVLRDAVTAPQPSGIHGIDAEEPADNVNL